MTRRYVRRTPPCTKCGRGVTNQDGLCERCELEIASAWMSYIRSLGLGPEIQNANTENDDSLPFRKRLGGVFQQMVKRKLPLNAEAAIAAGLLEPDWREHLARA